ncbi:MAG: 30S ribosomal protein S7 [Candidatus Yanofskybacteria bacterium]|nr:30S ribosomal protein S7 [Candidatus Yanofskybacteria bacterium]
MRRPVKHQAQIEPDIQHSSLLVAKVINKIMSDGKKSAARKIVYRAMTKAEKQLSVSGITIIEKAIDNVSPNMELKSRRVGGANYQVPIEVRPERRLALAIRWIVDAARAQKGKSMEVKLSEELVNAYNNTGNAIKKKLDTHRMADANRAFAHLAW